MRRKTQKSRINIHDQGPFPAARRARGTTSRCLTHLYCQGPPFPAPFILIQWPCRLTLFLYPSFLFSYNLNRTVLSLAPLSTLLPSQDLSSRWSALQISWRELSPAALASACMHRHVAALGDPLDARVEGEVGCGGERVSDRRWEKGKVWWWWLDEVSEIENGWKCVVFVVFFGWWASLCMGKLVVVEDSGEIRKVIWDWRITVANGYFR